MDGLVLFSGFVGALLLLDIAAVLFGVDTRDSIPDDHARA
jgi:hypothetical protein